LSKILSLKKEKQKKNAHFVCQIPQNIEKTSVFSLLSTYFYLLFRPFSPAFRSKPAFSHLSCQIEKSPGLPALANLQKVPEPFAFTTSPLKFPCCCRFANSSRQQLLSAA
jgi:hypothetical protein